MTPEILDHIPDGLLEKPAPALYQQLNGPTLIHLEGRDPRPLFVSVLQHGNEDAGWEAVRRLLRARYRQDRLPRSLSLLIGNVAAARYRRRRLDGQPDFNRCWPGGAHSDNETGALFRQITDHMRERQPFASIDIHNNTGLNPHYAAVTHIQEHTLRLAAQFCSTVVFFTSPTGVQTSAFNAFCPALTLECGQAGVVHGTDHAMTFLEYCLRLRDISTAVLDPRELRLFNTVATVYVAPGTEFGFLPEQRPLSFVANLDHLNFIELPAGTLLGHHQGNGRACLQALDNNENDVTEATFDFSNGEIRTRMALMPSMLTPDERVIRQDCLCYLMRRVAPEHPQLRAAGEQELPEPRE